MKSPVFIFSLPRSGSTLLQRVLMSHNEIASLAEPWILLPYLYAKKKHGILAEYSHRNASHALNDFVNNLPNQTENYNDELNKFVTSLYSKQCRNNEIYFLDKTPRYYLIIEEIAQIFPNAKFIFLFRNPLQVIGSIIKTWCNGTLKGLHQSDIDLIKGSQLLADGYEILKDKSYAVQYEAFVNNPEKHVTEICEYLEISFDSTMLENFSKQDTKGRMGDPTGTKKYNTIEKKSLFNWKTILDNKYRINHIKKYIQQINEKDLKVMGYDKNELLKSLCEHKVKSLFSIKDYIQVLRWKIIVNFLFPLFRRFLLKEQIDFLSHPHTNREVIN